MTQAVLFGDAILKVSASNVAWYGAIVATLSAIKVVLDLVNDRGRIKVTHSVDVLIGDSALNFDENKRYIDTKVINKGRRPVKIIQVGARFYDSNNRFLFTASFEKDDKQRTLTEANPMVSFLTEQEGLQLDKLWFVYATDAIGKEYREYTSLKARIIFWRYKLLKTLERRKK